MEQTDVLQKLLRSFERYYDVKTEGVAAPFVAEAEFHAHAQQYVLVKTAHIADIDSNEYVFFAQERALTCARLAELDGSAWSAGLSRVTPYMGHRCSDIALIIVAETIDDDAFARIKKTRHSKSYRCSLYGWSNFRALAYETSSGRVAYNRLGKDLRRLVGNL
ncbi:MAG: hypothetical protein K2J50_02610 [Treponemataceae bacterium]|nr:hypothetical protein [Treponemataceae bacterium]